MIEQEKGKKKDKWKTSFISLIIFLVIMFILAALAIPDFMKMMAKGKNAPQLNDLPAIYQAQKSYFDKNGRYAGHEAEKKCFELLEWEPESKNNLYIYYCDTDVFPSRIGDNSSCPIPEVPPVTKGSFTIFAVANIDSDPACDVWSINDAGYIYAVFDDVSDSGTTRPRYRINKDGVREHVRFTDDLKKEEIPGQKPSAEQGPSREVKPSDQSKGGER